MRWLHRLRALVRNLFRRSAVDRDLHDELASYVDLTAAEARARGMADDAAARHARVRLGGTATVTESVRAGRTGARLERCWQDVRHAARGLRRSPGYAAAAMLTLAVGLGASTAIFSAIDAAIFKPLPYQDPDRLVQIAQVFGRSSGMSTMQVAMNWDALDRWRAEPGVFAGIAPYAGQQMTVEAAGTTVRGGVSLIGPDMTDLLGIRMQIGRSFVADEAAADAAVAVLSDTFWRTAFRADPTVLGRAVVLNGRSFAVVGVASARLRWGLGGAETLAFVPLDGGVQNRAGGRATIGAIARLRPELTRESANAALARRVEALQAGVPAEQRWDAELLPLDERRMTGQARRTALLAVMAAAGFVVLIACANLSNLALARALARRHELAVRAALGATRLRLMGHVMVEGGLVALGGAIGAVVLARWMIEALPATLPVELQLFNANPAALDLRALAICALGAAVAGALCAWTPAIRVMRSVASDAVTAYTRVAGSEVATHRFRMVMQSAQVALTLVLLAGAGLLAMSFSRMVRADAGYDIDRILIGAVELPQWREGAAPIEQAVEQWRRQLNAVPGVRAAAGQAPGAGSSGRLIVAGRENDVPRGGILSVVHGGPEYFSVAGISLKEGRLFDDRDVKTSTAVAVIDERTAVLNWPGESALGKRFRWFPNLPRVTIVGVVGPVKTKWFTSADGSGQAYLPVAQFPYRGFRSVIVRADGDRAAAAGAMRATLQAVDPSLKLGVTPASALYDDVLAEPRFLASLASGFAIAALLTAGIGLYGIVNHAVGQRTREIGVRMALGATAGHVRGLVWREAMTPMALGVPVGLLAAWWLARYLATQLYSTSVHDPAAFAGVIALLVSVAAVAAYLPARRATRINPVETLRAE